MSSPQLIHLEQSSVESTGSATADISLYPVPVVDNSVVEGQFTLNNCSDVHVGPKYEHSGNVIINQNISVNGNSSTVPDLIAFKKVFQNSKKKSKIEVSDEPLHLLCQRKLAFVIISSAILLVIIFLTLMITYKGFHTLYSNSTTAKQDMTRETNLPQLDKSYPLKLKFVKRDDWGAAQPVEEFENNTAPLDRAIFIHTVSAGTCNSFAFCKQRVLSFQDEQMVHLGDIGYNFVIGSDGYIYVGVGWDKLGRHTKGSNWGSLGIAFIGDFRTDEPNDLMLASAKRLLEFGVELGKLNENYQVFGHCQTSRSFPLSPGKNIMKEIRTWPHWNSTNLNWCKG